MYPMCSSCYLQ